MYVFGIRTGGVFYSFLFDNIFFLHSYFFGLEKREIILGVMMIFFWHKCLCEHLTLNQSFSVCGTWCRNRPGERPRRDVHFPETDETRDCVRSTAERRKNKRENQTKDSLLSLLLLLQQMHFCRRCYCEIVISSAWVCFSFQDERRKNQSESLCGHEFFLLKDARGVSMLYFCLHVWAFSHLIIQPPFVLSPTTKGRSTLLANI